jgi:pimeloyl-ACP methyl ester carboxylesterase
MMSFACGPAGNAVAYQTAGAPGGRAVLVCHGLADSRRCIEQLDAAARALDLRLIAPDRPGIGRSEMRHLERVVDWVPDALAVLDAAAAERAAVLGISGGGAFAAACAALAPERLEALVLVAALGMPEWPSRGISPGERVSLALATRWPAFGGWFLGRLAALARVSGSAFHALATSELPAVDRRALAADPQRRAFLEGYLESFRGGHRGVAQDLRVLRRPWGLRLEEIGVRAAVHHGDADATVPLEHGRRFAAAIPGASLRIHEGHGHFSIIGEPAREWLAAAARASARQPRAGR